MIVINDATGRHEITAMQAVARSQQMSAIKGSVFAQRDVLNRAMAEDSREAQERQERFDTWSTYKEKCTAEMKVPRKPGAIPRDYLPHPDDIVLEYSTCTVRFLGALDETSRAHELKMVRFRDLAFELAMFHDEPDAQYEDHTVGVYRALSLAIMQLLPPRLQLISLQLEQGILLRALGPRAAWKEHLQEIGKEFNIRPWPDGYLPPRIPATALNLTKSDLCFAESLSRALSPRKPKRSRARSADANLTSSLGEIPRNVFRLGRRL